MASEDIKKLKLRRGQIKAQLTRFITYLDNVNEDAPDCMELQTRVDAAVNILSEFNKIQALIEETVLSEKGEIDEELVHTDRDDFETRYFSSISRAKKMLNRVISRTQTPSSVVTGGLTNLQTNVKLPQIKLPEFTGSYDTWVQFRDTFNALINSNTALTDIQKFYYLQGALKNEAAQVISSLPISEVNYTIAWKLLEDRYENKKAIVNAHIKSIFDLPATSRESHISLRKLLDSFLKHYRSLQNLGENVDQWDTILIYLMNSKLDLNSKKDWEKYSNDITSPKVSDFTKYLIQRCQMLEAIDTKHEYTVSSITSQKRTAEIKNFFVAANLQGISCPFCRESHYIYHCKKFLDVPINSRYSEIKRLNLCTNCLRSGHVVTECRSSGCRKCQKKHNSLLHLPRAPSRNGSSSSQNVSLNQATNHELVNNTDIEGSQARTNHSNSQNNTQINSHTSSSNNNLQNSQNYSISSHCYQKPNSSFVLLATALIYVHDQNKQPIQCRALLDNGSQSNFVTESLLERLKLKTNDINLPVLGINQIKTNISKQVNIQISSIQTSFKKHLSFLVINKITDFTPQQSIDFSKLNIPDSIGLADPTFNQPSKIDLLLGAGIFFELLCIGQIKLDKSQLILQNTKLGWIISGHIPHLKNLSTETCLFSNNEVSKQIERFWLIEEPCLTIVKYSKEEAECEEHFKTNFFRDQTGKFVVKLPLKTNYTELGDSLDIAISRFYSTERKLQRNPDCKKEYSNFMAEYHNLGHMTRIDPSQENTIPVYYLPHHAVEKQDSVTTKLRVVFDGSAKTTTDLSLNNVLKVGPTVQDDLFSIILRFRRHNVVLIADVAKMYRMVLIHPEHRDLQRIVWRENPNEELKHFRLNTVTYGTASAPFLATRCLQQIALDNSNNFPIESKIILSDFYVDDMLTGASNSKDLVTIRQNISNILNSYGFELRKFQSNDPHVLDELQHTKHSQQYVITDNLSIKTLGVSWNPITDNFEYNSLNHSHSQTHSHISKRNLLSYISKIFDPLGLLGPIIVQAKILMQQLWRLQVEWDEPLPTEFVTHWTQFHEQICQIESIYIPRHVLTSNPCHIQIHGFADSSERAFGACVYLRSTDVDGTIHVHLLCAKSRVAPLKPLSLARLELCAALLSAQLVDKCKNTLNITINEFFLWTDSTIVLSWLSSEPSTWKTFVCNRVAEIQQLTQIDSWHHISSSENPADIISRGTNLNQLIHTDLWWHGPSFLSKGVEFWPAKSHISNFSRNHVDTSEQKASKGPISLTCSNSLDLFSRFSSLKRLQRVVAYCLRFSKNSRLRPESRITGSLTANEIVTSTQTLIRIVQAESFSDDIFHLKAKHKVRVSSRLSSLSPFLDNDDLIRVGGRLSHSQLVFNHKHPIVLPAKHSFTGLIIQDEHKRSLHSGIQTTLSHIRQNYWPLNGKQAVKSVIRNCITCFKAKPTSLFQKMGDLPSPRVQPSRIFTHCGIDYAGPFSLKDGKTKNRKILKAYICIFICLASKAIHCELVSELTTKCFISALKRFVARRGLCSHVYSDNGLNFVGANNELKEINKLLENSEFKDYLSHCQITWHFIPPRAPHFGGLWEAAVKSIKHHLKRVLNDMPLTFEEFYTLLTQIESILNSRPITPLSQDPNDLEAITPGHFIIGEALSAIPDKNRQHGPVNYVARYDHIQRMAQHFWSRWTKEYLHQLQQRSKWKFVKDTGHLVDSLVLLKEDNTPPLHWPMGRITNIHCGEDGLVRVLTVKTQRGTVTRVITKVCLLPIEQISSVSQD